MHRDRSTLLVALFALPDPPGCRLFKRESCTKKPEIEAVADGPSRDRPGCGDAGACCSRLNRLDDETRSGRGDADAGFASGGDMAERPSCGRRGHGEQDACLVPPGTDAARSGERRARPPRVHVKGEGAAVGDGLVLDCYGHGARKEPPCGGDLVQSTKIKPHLMNNREARGKLHADIEAKERTLGRFELRDVAGNTPEVHMAHEKSCGRCAEVPPSRDTERKIECCDGLASRTAADVGTKVVRTASDPSTSAASGVQDSESSYDPSLEILLCSGEVLSPWRKIWEATPLVLHDRNLAQWLNRKSELYDLTAFMSRLLELHPGPIRLFRLDSSKWTGGEYQLSKWLNVLSMKNAVEIVVFNREDQSNLEFPLQDIESSCLKTVRLGFFSLSRLDVDCFIYGMLETLQLIGCTFRTMQLYYVVQQCKSLTHLGIGISETDIKIHSKSLRFLQLWRCTMRNFVIECAPNLSKIVIVVHPKEKSVQVSIREAPELQDVQYLLLPYHNVENKSCLKTLEKMRVGLEMSSSSQRTLLCECIQQASNLQELCLWRIDEIDISEEIDAIVDDSLLILSSGQLALGNLKIFCIEDFRAGGFELAIASAILRYAVRLINVCLYAYPHSPQDSIAKAVMELRSRKKASTPTIQLELSGAND